MENEPLVSSQKDILLKIPTPTFQQYAIKLIALENALKNEYFDLYCQKKPEVINLLDEKGKDEIRNHLFNDFRQFLLHSSEGTIIEYEIKNLKSNNLIVPGFKQIKIKFIDQNMRLHLIKKVLLKYLPSYTETIEEAIKIVAEVDEVMLYLENYLSNIQIDINKQNLQNERDFANSLITYSTNGIIAFTNELVVTAWNNVMEEKSGIRKDFVLGKKIFDLFPDFRETEEGEAVFKVLKGEKVFITEKSFANGKGYYEASAVPLFGLEQEVKGGFIVFNDITNNKNAAREIENGRIRLEQVNAQLILQIKEFKKSQKELKNNEKLLKKTQQLAHIGTWFWDAKNNKISWSEELKDIFEVKEGLKSASIKSYLMKVHPEDRSTFLKRIRKAVRFQEQFDYEHRIISNNGDVKYIYGQGVPEVLHDKLIITGFSQDITQKRQAIETLQASEHRFRTLCEKSPDSIFLISGDTIIYCNQASVKMFDAEAKSQILKLDIKSLPYSDPADEVISEDFMKEKIREAFKEESLRFECRLKTVSGGAFWSEIIFTPIQLEQNDILHAVIRDISKRKKAEKEIKLAQEELKMINNELEKRIDERTYDLEEINKNLMRVNADMDNFIYSASHDLKAPILNIEGLINELVQLEAYKRPDVKMLIDMISICVNKFTRTIEDLTDITKSLRSDFDDAQTISIAELVEDITISINNLILSSGAIVDLDLRGSETIHFSRRNLRSVLYNLINNAIKYRSQERTPFIHISTEIENDKVVLNVRDNGLGIKEKDQMKVFSMFKRVHTHVEGSGVGLYLVKRIMENGGGSVKLQSEEGVGSIFKLYFNK